MRRPSWSLYIGLTVVVLGLWAGRGVAQGSFELVTGKAFEGAVPKEFYLEGNAIPTEKRNSALLKTASGSRAVVGLIDTTGYSSQIRKKYIGMLITETELSINGHKLGVGSYGFGLEQPAAGAGGGKLEIYNQAGAQVAECTTKKDTELKQPRPLHVVPEKDSARLYLGRYWVEIK